MSFVWDDSYSLGIEAIDEQHKRLVYMLQDMEAAMNAGRGGNLTLDVINRMREYAAEHFADEEALLEQHGYPNLPTHLAEHNVFRSRVEELSHALPESDQKKSREVLNFLFQWLVEHIQGTDRAYAAYLKERGVA